MSQLQEFLDEQESYYTDDDSNPVAEYVSSLGYGVGDTDEILERFVKELDDDRLEALIRYHQNNFFSNKEIVKELCDSANLESGDIRHQDYTLYSRICGEIEVEFEGKLHYINLSDTVWRLIVDVEEAVARLESLLPPAVDMLIHSYGGDI
jgi:hypothetical protein